MLQHLLQKAASVSEKTFSRRTDHDTVVPAARYSACEIAWHMYMMGSASVAVCGVVPTAATCCAGIVGWRICTGTIEGPALLL